MFPISPISSSSKRGQSLPGDIQPRFSGSSLSKVLRSSSGYTLIEDQSDDEFKKQASTTKWTIGEVNKIQPIKMDETARTICDEIIGSRKDNKNLSVADMLSVLRDKELTNGKKALPSIEKLANSYDPNMDKRSLVKSFDQLAKLGYIKNIGPFYTGQKGGHFGSHYRLTRNGHLMLERLYIGIPLEYPIRRIYRPKFVPG